MTEPAPRLDHPAGELRWVRDRRWDAVAAPTTEAALAAYDHLLVVAAHPDDECLGAGGFIADAASHGVPVTVLLLTEGEGSHPRSPTVSGPEMSRRRAVEADRAAEVLAPGARVVHAGLPDGGLSERHEAIVTAVRDLTRPGTLVLAPWTADGHPDHDAAGRGAAAAVAAARAEAGAAAAGSADGGPAAPAVAHYLVWFWHWGDPADLPWADVVVCDATLDGLDRRARALAQHHSQVAPLSGEAGDEMLLTEGVLAPSRRGFTALIVPAGGPAVAASSTAASAAKPRAEAFDEMFDDGDDPWSSQSWYEQRKRALTLAVLRQERYDRVLDLGCSTGVLTRSLSDRSGEVLAVDVSKRALEVAEREAARDARRADITWVRGEAPWVLDEADGPFDLVVLSEIGYFLRPFELWLTVGRLVERLAPGGEMVFVHWRHPTEDIPLDGPSVHAQVRAILEPWAVMSHVEEDVLIDGYRVPR